MIIVSQDETSIINFDNIEEIYVSGKFISVNYSLNNNECIAEYKTEERAKEVLQEIIDKFMEYGQIQNLAGDIKQVCEIPKKYEMPKE